MGDNLLSILQRPGTLSATSTYTLHPHLERTLQLRFSTSAQHGKQQLPVISHRYIGVKRGARGCFRRWERSLHLNGQLPPASSWAAPSQKGVVPSRSAVSSGCLGIRSKTEWQLVKLSTRQNKKEKAHGHF